MLLKRLEISNYLDIEWASINFQARTNDIMSDTIVLKPHRYHLVSIVGSNHSVALDQLNNIVDLLITVASPRIAESAMQRCFADSDGTTTITTEFEFNKVNYKHIMKLSDMGVKKELLFADSHLKYNSRDNVRPVPLFPEGIGNFFKKIYIADLADPAFVNRLIHDSIEMCQSNDTYLKNVSDLLMKLGLMQRNLILDAGDLLAYDDPTDTYMDIRTVNKTIREVFGLFSVLFQIIGNPSLLVIKNFGDLDIVKKITLLKFFKRVVNASSKSQILAIDYNDNKSYDISKTMDGRLNTFTFVRDMDTDQYVFESMED
jgi:hypothetical protein